MEKLSPKRALAKNDEIRVKRTRLQKLLLQLNLLCVQRRQQKPF